MKETLRFWKTQAVGNDFVLVHEADVPRSASLSELAVTLCDRHRGVGADGLLVMRPGHLAMFNPDGTEDFCGNGLRCATVHAYHQGWIGPEATLEHAGLQVEARITGEHRARVQLPPALWEPDAVPHRGEDELFQAMLPTQSSGPLLVSALSTGSTHLVVMVDELPQDDLFFGLSPELEHHPMFPERTSVMWALALDDRRLRLRIWERGAGETLGCGTGSVATAVAWARARDLAGEFTVGGPGGEIAIHFDHWTAPIEMESDVEQVFTGEFLLGAVLATR